MDEMKAILNAILKSQETTNAKLEALTMDVRIMQGEIAGIKGEIVEMKGSIVKLDEKLEQFRVETKQNFRKYERHLSSVELDLDKTIERVEHLETQSSI